MEKGEMGNLRTFPFHPLPISLLLLIRAICGHQDVQDANFIIPVERPREIAGHSSPREVISKTESRRVTASTRLTDLAGFISLKRMPLDSVSRRNSNIVPRPLASTALTPLRSSTIALTCD